MTTRNLVFAGLDTEAAFICPRSIEEHLAQQRQQRVLLHTALPDGPQRARMPNMIKPMKRVSLLLSLLAFSVSFAAEDFGKLIFQDDFARNESQENTDEPGNGWTTNSKSRAKGHKQVD